MLKKKMLSAAMIAAPLAFGVVVAGAQDKAASKAAPAAEKKEGTNADKDKRGTSAQTRAVELGTLADSLARYGDANKDAMSLITAARIMKDIGVQDVKADKKSEGTGGTGAAKPARDLTVAGLVARAKQHAGGRKDLIALADEVAAAGSRGAVGGPKRTVTDVRAGYNDIFNIAFRGGESAMVAISGDGDTDLDLRIIDENGNTVCHSNGPTDDEVCRWYPRWTGNFRIEVKNLGRVYNNYRLWTN